MTHDLINIHGWSHTFRFIDKTKINQSGTIFDDHPKFYQSCSVKPPIIINPQVIIKGIHNPFSY